MAAIELGVFQRPYLARRIANKPFLTAEVQAWAGQRHQQAGTVNWHFSNADAPLKLRKLYPSIIP